MALQRLREAAEKAKIELSQVDGVADQPALHTTAADGPLHLDARLTRAEFQRMTSDLLDRCKGPFQQVIKDASDQARARSTTSCSSAAPPGCRRSSTWSSR